MNRAIPDRGRHRLATPRAGARRRSAGFTLLELVIVIAIFAVFSLMAYGGLDAVLNTRRQVETAQLRLAQMQKTYLRLRNDLQQVRARPIRDAFGDVQPPLRTRDNGYVEFTRGGWRNPLGLPRPGLERVAYRYEDGKLIRMSWRVLDQSQDSAPVEAVLLDGIEDLRWQFLDTTRSWQARWPMDMVAAGAGTAAPPAPPPLAVELTLRLRDAGELRYLFRLGADKVELPQQAGGAGGAAGGDGGDGGGDDGDAPPGGDDPEADDPEGERGR